MSLVSAAESRNEEIHLQNFAASLDCKVNMTREIDRREREGIIAPDPIPHPDDIVVNPRTGDFTIRGPLDETEKADLENARRRRVELKQTLQQLEELLASTRNKARAKIIMSAMKRAKEQLEMFTQFIDENDSPRNRSDGKPAL